MTAQSFRAGVRIGVDYGGARIGVAVTDPAGRFALPHETVARSKWGEDVDQIADLAEQLAAIEIVVGLPKHLSGASGASAKSARKFAHKLGSACPQLRVCMVDERLTTSTAHEQLAAAGIDNRRRKDKVDQVAATVILEQAIEIERRTGKEPGETISRGRPAGS
ncbi:Holliday junction resolvase RuvX [Gleimia hominis]|uniref:Putative pre-16S rRNA nuclease n=1 Tax=Gleimia hominis TaxID=595468 RepID=A0ABU3IBC5_9ACTO|nr:Holliday junction resolvase RuvX [Gleimia hominis]MDT3767682.1 Holliday junction resolvase RuvX [Gleimia hominis]